MTDEAAAMVQRIATNLTRLMRKRRISSARVAERSMLDVDVVEAIVAGAIEPRVDEVFLLAGALEVEPAVLLEGIEWIPDRRGGGSYRIREHDP